MEIEELIGIEAICMRIPHTVTVLATISQVREFFVPLLSV